MVLASKALLLLCYCCAVSSKQVTIVNNDRLVVNNNRLVNNNRIVNNNRLVNNTSDLLAPLVGALVTIVVLFQAPHYNCPISCSCAIPLHLCYFNTFVLFLAHTCTRARTHTRTNTHTCSNWDTELDSAFFSFSRCIRTWQLLAA